MSVVAPSFGRGDVVQLASGGVKMTVESNQDDEIHVTWLDGIGHLHRAFFHKDCLDPVGPK